MKMKLPIVKSILLLVAALGCNAAEPAKVHVDLAHRENPAAAATRPLVGPMPGIVFAQGTAPLTADLLAGCRALYLPMPVKPFTAEEKAAVIAFVKSGGSLLLVLDEERRQSLATTGVNDLIAPFGLKLTGDTEYLHNQGAVAKAGEINAADREIPYSGGRAVEGGTPFAWRLDREGRPAEPFAAWKKLENGARIIVLGDGMAISSMGRPEGVRLSGVPRDASKTVYWGKDSAAFVREVFAWLVK